MVIDFRRLCKTHRDVNYQTAWGCPDCLKELRTALAAIHTLAVDAYDDAEDARHIEPMPTLARILEESK